MALAARLPQETDPTAHRMLHVLMKALLGRVGGPGRQKVLGLVLALDLLLILVSGLGLRLFLGLARGLVL